MLPIPTCLADSMHEPTNVSQVIDNKPTMMTIIRVIIPLLTMMTFRHSLVQYYYIHMYICIITD